MNNVYLAFTTDAVCSNFRNECTFSAQIMKAMHLNELVVILVVVLVVLVIWLGFFLKNKRIRKLHMQDVLYFSEEFTVNKHQILIRKKGLDCYDFLKYNLSEALIIQSEINI